MKKICLVTSEESFLTNFGASLQGYALYRFLKEKDNNVKILRYKGSEVSENNNNNKRLIIKRMTKYSASEIYIKILFRVKKKLLKSEINKQRKLFQSFQDEYMSFYNKDRKTWITVKDSYPHADIYVCGSDQIWNPMFKNGYNDPGYFLNFVSNKIKIAYAPSFGVSDIPATASKDLSSLLKDFTAVSVREKEGAQIIKKYTGRDVTVQLDPTMLYDGDHWRSIGVKPDNIPDKYILCYRFGNSLDVNSTIHRISEKLSLPIITLPLSGISYLNKNEKKLFNAGPREFIGLIDNAALVCTDSFHATVFSVLLNTPFITFLRGESLNKGEGMNSRVTNLLGMLKLNNRIINSHVVEEIDKWLSIDTSEANKILSIERKKSREWLNSALNNEVIFDMN